jgi:hypothetical protein
VLPVHPAAELFPLMSETELRVIGEDIKRHGLASRIVLWSPVCGSKEVCLIDGRNRLDAMELVGLNTADVILPKEAAATHADPYAYVLAANIHRRHLTVDQKKEIVVKLLRAKPETPNLQIAKQVKVDDKTVAKVRTDLERRSEIPNVKTKTDTKGRKQPAHKPKPKAAPPAEHGHGGRADVVAAGLYERLEQKTFDSPQEAHAPAKAIGLGALAISWREVEAQAAAGNKPRLLTALGSHMEQVRRALKDWGEGVQ